jgi:DNA-binding response OmpR family regulator
VPGGSGFQSIGSGLALVIDESPEGFALQRGALEAAHFQVEQAFDGFVALAMAVVCRPDVIILDCSRPLVEGRQTLRLLAGHVRTRHIPVILATSRPDLVPPEVQARIAVLISKPCDPDDIAGAARALVPRRRATPAPVRLVK